MDTAIDRLLNHPNFSILCALTSFQVHQAGLITYLGKQFQVCTRTTENGELQIVLLGVGDPTHDLATSFGVVKKISVWNYRSPLEKETRVVYKNGEQDQIIFEHRSTPLSAAELRESIFGDAVPRTIDPQPEKIRKAIQVQGQGDDFSFRVDGRQDSHLEIRYYAKDPIQFRGVPGVFQFIFGQEESSGKHVFVQARALDGSSQHVYQFP